MKVLMYRVDNRVKGSRRAAGLNFERLLFITFLIGFSLLVLVQAALTNPQVRAVLSMDAELEGIPLEEEVFLFNEGSLILQLENHEPDPNVKILINGKKTGSFEQNPVEIAVRDGDMVEIDGSGIDYRAEVTVASKTENIVTECIGLSIKTDSNVRKLVKVQVE